MLRGRTAIIRLADTYAPVLTRRQQSLLRMYYHHDLSLGEIAVRLGVSRQAVFDSLRRSIAEMRRWEARLGMAAGRDREVRDRAVTSVCFRAVDREMTRLAKCIDADLGPLTRALAALRERL
jgi:uncharacterized protein